MASALAQHDGVGESCTSRGNMHGGSTSEIKSSHLEHPTRRVPCPACNWVINDCRPNEHEDHTRKHTATLSNSSNSKSNSDSSEHALVNGEKEVRDLGGPNGWCCKDISEPNVLQIADVLASCVRKGERVTPKEPLEGNDGCGHDGKPDEGQRRLSPSETRIEEAVQRKVSFLLHTSHVVNVPTRHLES